MQQLQQLDTQGARLTRQVQGIADRATRADYITLGWEKRIDGLLPNQGYLRQIWESAAKGSYIHKEVGKLVENSSEMALKSNTVGPDLTSTIGGKLAYEVTQFTPSMNAILTHARRYPDSLLRYVTYQ
jgi:hypothetical protein